MKLHHNMHHPKDWIGRESDELYMQRVPVVVKELVPESLVKPVMQLVMTEKRLGRGDIF